MKSFHFFKIFIYLVCCFSLFSCSKKTEILASSLNLSAQATINQTQSSSEKDFDKTIDFSKDQEKLINMLTTSPLPFSNAKGEASEIAQNILNNKEAFLSDLRRVLKSDTDNLLIKVDKQTALSADYKPTDLVHLGTEKDYWVYRNDLNLRIPVESSLAIMAQDAFKQGVKLVVSSSYRSYRYQNTVYNRIVGELGQAAADRESARPGTSQHQLGTVVDFGSITDDFANTKAGKWLAKNAATYGWSLSFPQNYENVTGYRWECWHYRYIGVPAVQFQQKWFKNIQQYMMEFVYNWRKKD